MAGERLIGPPRARKARHLAENFVILDFLRCSLVHFLSDKSAPKCIKCNTMRTGGRYGQSISLQGQRSTAQSCYWSEQNGRSLCVTGWDRLVSLYIYIFYFCLFIYLFHLLL